MTKHIYTMPDAIFQIDAGWERGRGSFYLTVYQDGRVSYDSDRDQQAVFGGMDMALLEQRLSRFSLRLPARVKEALLQDQAQNAAPYVKHYETWELFDVIQA